MGEWIGRKEGRKEGKRKERHRYKYMDRYIKCSPSYIIVISYVSFCIRFFSITTYINYKNSFLMFGIPHHVNM